MDLRFIAIGLKGTPFILFIPTHFCLLNILTVVLHTLHLQSGVSPITTPLSLGCVKLWPRKKCSSTVMANNHQSMNHGGNQITDFTEANYKRTLISSKEIQEIVLEFIYSRHGVNSGCSYH